MAGSLAPKCLPEGSGQEELWNLQKAETWEKEVESLGFFPAISVWWGGNERFSSCP